MNRLFAMLGLLALSLLAPARAELPQYLIHVLDIPGMYPTVTGINNQGHAVGYYYSSYPNDRAFYWDGTFHDLGPGRATAINNFGIVVGYEPYGAGNAWYWDGEFHTVAQGYAFGISDTGYIVGQDYADYQAYRWKDGVKTPLGYLGDGPSAGRAVNDQGIVVGEADVGPDFPGQAWHAFLWDGQMNDLGTYSGTKYSRLFDINGSATAVGESFSNDTGYFAVLYNGTFHSLPLSTSAAINDAGTIAGTIWIGGLTRAALLSDSGELALLPGIVNESAAHVLSNNGWAAGTAYDAAGAQYAVIWEPVPEPCGLSSLALLTAGLAFGRRAGRGRCEVLSTGVEPSCRISPYQI